MNALTPAGTAAVERIARQRGFGFDAARTMLDAVYRGHGSMAQFSHPEFGGAGQWMRGGMTMVSDLFDSRLRDRVSGLCADLAQLLGESPGVFASVATAEGDAATASRSTGGAAWWPPALGSPDASGSQNGSRYAWFTGARRLAIERDGELCLYDTQDHRLGGVAQQQSAGSSLSFSSQHGRIDVTALPRVEMPGDAAVTPSIPATDLRRDPPRLVRDDAFLAIEKLAALHARGIVDDAEFAAKKAELLGRI